MSTHETQEDESVRRRTLEQSRGTRGLGLAAACLFLVLVPGCTRSDPAYLGPRDAAPDVTVPVGDAALDLPDRDSGSGGTGGNPGTGGADGKDGGNDKANGKDAQDARDAATGGVAGSGGRAGAGGRGGNAGGAGGMSGGAGGAGGSLNGGSGGGGAGGAGGAGAKGGNSNAAGNGGGGNAAGNGGGGTGAGGSMAGNGGNGGGCHAVIATATLTHVATFTYSDPKGIAYDTADVVKGNGTQEVAWFQFDWPSSLSAGSTLTAAELHVMFENVADSGPVAVYLSNTQMWPTMAEAMNSANGTIDLTAVVSLAPTTPSSTTETTSFSLNARALQPLLDDRRSVSLGLDATVSTASSAGVSLVATPSGATLQLGACVP